MHAHTHTNSHLCVHTPPPPSTPLPHSRNTHARTQRNPSVSRCVEDTHRELSIVHYYARQILTQATSSLFPKYDQHQPPPPTLHCNATAFSLRGRWQKKTHTHTSIHELRLKQTKRRRKKANKMIYSILFFFPSVCFAYPPIHPALLPRPPPPTHISSSHHKHPFSVSFSLGSSTFIVT